MAEATVTVNIKLELDLMALEENLEPVNKHIDSLDWSENDKLKVIDLFISAIRNSLIIN